MIAIDDLARHIDEALRPQPPGAHPALAPEALERLVALAIEFASGAPSDAKAAVAGLAAIHANPPQGALPAGANEFEGALLHLRDVLERQKKNEFAAARLAEDPELVQEFIVEVHEHLANVEAGILRIERNPGDSEALNAVFRSFHTIKGLAAFLGAAAIQELAHETENLLDLARSGKLPVTAEVTDVILRSSDALTKCLNAATQGSLSVIPRCESELFTDIAVLGRETAEAPASAFCPLELPGENGGNSGGKAPATKAPETKSAVPGKKTAGNVLRVDAAKLEHLIDMVGELVIAESVVRHDPAIARSEDPLLSRNLTQLARVVQQVQKTSMSMRMVAIGTLFAKMSRLVRDLSRKLGKPVELVTAGDDVELDRSIVEDLADPIVHMIRNSVDHGLETPDERAAAGKPESGTVRLKAMHDAGDIVIEIGDDGRGLNAEKILAKARSLGLAADGDRPNEDTIFKMIFEPGFSTAETVTDLSGRGVGMDVVRKRIQKLRGRIAIRSVPGEGCTFTLRLPLTLAIIDGLVVGVGSQRYILPMFAVREMFPPGPDTFVTLENRAEAAMFRDKLLPVIRLSRLLEGPGSDRDGGVLIVAEGRNQVFCIAVDQVSGKQEVVIRNLGKTYRDVPAISGGAILGDGRVGLIIDVNSLRYQN